MCGNHLFSWSEETDLWGKSNRKHGFWSAKGQNKGLKLTRFCPLVFVCASLCFQVKNSFWKRKEVIWFQWPSGLGVDCSHFSASGSKIVLEVHAVVAAAAASAQPLSESLWGSGRTTGKHAGWMGEEARTLPSLPLGLAFARWPTLCWPGLREWGKA